jgi:Fe-S-cluster containining protein
MHIVDKLFLFPIFATILPFQTYFYNIPSLKHHIETSLSLISDLSLENFDQNERFKNYLKNTEIAGLDSLVHRLNSEVSAQINCQECGNCCKTLMIVVTEKEAERVSNSLQINRTDFDHQYLEKGGHELMLMNCMPCSFLKNNSCTIYENRFEGCREFPALHLPDFNKKLFSHFMHYGRCPIIFNVIERLKMELNFENQMNHHD